MHIHMVLTGPIVCSSEPPLFYQPGKAGYYSPRTISAKSVVRMNAYRNVGRMVGLCLLHTEIMPLTLCRHVFKFLATRQVSPATILELLVGVLQSHHHTHCQ